MIEGGIVLVKGKEEALIVIRLARHASPRFTVHRDSALGVLLKMKVLREGGR